jgi:energy-coupling factor transporter ATP-binding protein EcfA2
VETKISVDIEKLGELLNHADFNKVKKDAKEKELVLVLGVTGAGKSTCISYFMGAKLVSGKDIALGKIAILDENQACLSLFPKIGLEMHRSCTLYAEIFDDPVLENVAYVDTAGFLDTRRIENEPQICSSLSMQYAIQSAKSIKAIVIVFEWAMFFEKVPTQLYAVSQILTRLLIVPEKYADSIIVVINKDSGKRTKEQFSLAVSDFTEEFEKRLKMAKEMSERFAIEIEELESVVNILNLLKKQVIQRPNNIVLMNVFDNGESREKIRTLIKENNAFIPKENFNFRDYNEKRKIFDSQIDIIAPLMQEYEKSMQGGVEKKEDRANSKIDTDPLEVNESKIIYDIDNVNIDAKGATENTEKERLLACEVLPLSDKLTSDPVTPLNEDFKNISNSKPSVIDSVHQEAVSNLLLHLVKTAQLPPKENPVEEGIVQDSKIEHQIPKTNADVTNFNCIARFLMGLAGVSLGLFGIGLLIAGISALLNWSLMVSIIQKMFHMALAESIAGAFIYGLVSIVFSIAVFYVRLNISLCGKKTQMNVNDVEDINETVIPNPIEIQIQKKIENTKEACLYSSVQVSEKGKQKENKISVIGGFYNGE